MDRDKHYRIGVLVPLGNTVHEREFAELGGASITFTFVGFGYPPVGPDFCDLLFEGMKPPIDALMAGGQDLILVGCTTASMTCAAAPQLARLEAEVGVPVITAASAVLEAASALRVGALAVATPYGETNNKIVSDFLTSNGFVVTGLVGLGLDASVETWIAGQPTLTPDKVLEISLAADNDGADALYLPCTGMGSVKSMQQFEDETGKPAISSVQAGYWASLRRLGVDGRQSGFGRLLETWDF